MNIAASPGTVHGIEQTLFFTLLQLLVIIGAARAAGRLARRWGQPRAVGEIAAGLLLGPSLLGWLAPELSSVLFHSSDGMPISIMSQIGLILLMFQVGLEFDFQHLQDRRTRIATGLIATCGIVIPFVLGLGLAVLSWHSLATQTNRLGYMLFLATALSITAVPILGRIMMEYQLVNTRLGVITITSAAINDAVGWTVLAGISAIVTAKFVLGAFVWQVAFLLVYVFIMTTAVRRILIWCIARFQITQQELSQDLTAILLTAVFASAMVTSQLGIFAIFGGFMMGMVLHDQHMLIAAWKARITDLVTVMLLPVFFTYTGLRTDIGGLDTTVLWGWFALLFLLATLGKFGGCYVAARLARMTHWEACNIGIMMNTRALMELIVVNIGFDLGVIPQQVFTMLVLMAIGSTVMTAPGLRRWLPRIGHTIPQGIDA